MDNEQIYNIIKKTQKKIAISQLKEDVYVKKNKILKSVASFILIFGITVGIVYAGTNISDRIWKIPEKVVGFSNNEIPTEEKQKSVLNESEARQKAEKILEKFGHKDEKINTIELENNQANYELTWSVCTDKNTRIYFNATGEKYFGISFDNVLNKNIKNYRTTEKEAEKTARDLCEKYGYDLEQYNYVKISSNMNSEDESYIWNVSFGKTYDGIVSPYECTAVGFIPEINEIYGFTVWNEKFENNPIEITEKRAKEIALEEEQKISTEYKMKEIEAELDIVQMNGDAYLRTNDYNQLREQTSANYPSEKQVHYRTDNRVRKAWIVTIEYDIPSSVNKFDNSYNMNDENFSYYIDATTGEVIGGSSVYKIDKEAGYR